MSDSSQSIWKPLFWLLFAALISVSLLYRHHSDQLRQTLAQERQALRSLDRSLNARESELAKATRALDAARTEISALETAHAEALASADGQTERARQGATAAMKQTPLAEPGEQRNSSLCEDAIEQASEQATDQVHAFYEDLIPLGARLTERGVRIDLRGDRMRFASGSATLPAEAAPTLDQIAAILLDHPDLQVLIQGHTDSAGSRELNLRLSQQRATTVRQALAERGVETARFRVQGLGSAVPVADNASAAGRQRNRRVELYLAREQNR
ncbi:OmpA family protein [Halochromatium salexigens]|uniref:OmpA family protein n=1 Tax=Halochromatium salexigens TaxID=49447 RepID=UPI001912EB92